MLGQPIVIPKLTKDNEGFNMEPYDVIFNLLSFHLTLSMSLDILHKNRKIWQHPFQFV
jgi:hypothetical protein